MGHVKRTGKRRSLYSILEGKPEGKRPLGKTRRTLKNNIKLDLQEVGCGGMDWIDLAQERHRCRGLVNPYRTNVENRVSSK